MFLAGCGLGASSNPTPRAQTAIPPTPTPRSTPLPDVAPPAPLGSEERPLAVRFVLPEGTAPRQAARLENDLVEAFVATEMNIIVDTVSNETEAFRTVCGLSGDGIPAAAWMSAYTYTSVARQCQGKAALAAFVSDGLAETVGNTFQIIGQADVQSLGDLEGKVFCRISAIDQTSWITPSLFLASAGVDPFTGLAGVMDYPDDLSLLRAVYNGECAAAAFPYEEYSSLRTDLIGLLDEEGTAATSATLDEKLTVLLEAGDTSLPKDSASWNGYPDAVIPYAILVFPNNSVIPQQTREIMQEIIADFFNDRVDGPGRAQSLIGADGVFTISSTDLDAFVSRMNQAGWDLIFVE